MRNSLLLICVIFLITTMVGCQSRVEDIINQNEKSNGDSLKIPSEDNIIKIKEDLFIAEELTVDSKGIKRNKLKIIEQNGRSTIIEENVEDWVVINADGEDIIYYTNKPIDFEDLYTKEYINTTINLSTYNIKTAVRKGFYERNEGSIRIIKDGSTGRCFLAIIQIDHGDNNGANIEGMIVVDLEKNETVFQQKDRKIIGYPYMHDNRLYYTRPEQNSRDILNVDQLFEFADAECMSTIASYDIVTHEEAVFFNPMDYHKYQEGGIAWEGVSSRIYMSDDENIYVNLATESVEYSWNEGDIYQINTNTGAVKKIVEQDTLRGWITDIFIDGEFMYTVQLNHSGENYLIAYKLIDGQQCILGSIYLGKDHKNYYVYDYQNDYSNENSFSYFTAYDDGKFIEPHELFLEPSRLYAIPIGSIKKSNVLLDEVEEYFDYHLRGQYSEISAYMNPIIKEGYIVMQDQNSKYALSKQNEETFIYKTESEIINFERVTMETIEELNLIILEDALVLEKGASKELTWAINNPDATLYIESSIPSIVSIDREGVAQANSPGSANITITAIKDGAKRDVKKLHVTVK